MARVAAVLLVGVLLFIAAVWLVSKITDGVQRHRATIWKLVVLIAVAGVAFWYFGNGLVFEYFTKQ
jgi:hypothetical protein